MNGASNTAPPAASTSRLDHEVGAKTSLPSIATISPSTLPFSGLQLALMAIAGLAALLGGMALRRGALHFRRAAP